MSTKAIWATRPAQGLSADAPASTQYQIDVGISERKLSDALLAANDAAGALHHAEQAAQRLCQEGVSAKNPNTLANCGRSHVAMGRAYLALRNPGAAQSALSKGEEIASSQSDADPANAIFRSDAARSQAALAAALAEAQDTEGARRLFQEALENWSLLRQARSITAEDAHRADEAASALTALPAARKL